MGKMRAAVTCVALAAAACSMDAATSSGLDLAGLDRSADPCADFYEYACGGWIASHPLGSDASALNRFQDPFYDAVDALETIVAGDAAGTSQHGDPNSQLIGTFFTSCVSAAQSTAARALLAFLVQDIDSSTTLADVARQSADQRTYGSGTFFRLGVGADPVDSTKSIVVLDQGGWELPTAGDYSDPAQVSLLASYRAHIINLSSIVLGAPIDADAVLRVETALADAAVADDQRRDPTMLYHLMTLDDIAAQAPSFPWAAFFAELGYELHDGDVLNVLSPDYLVALDHILTTTPIVDLQTYMRWQLIQDRVGQLDQAVLDVDFDFWKQLSGQEMQSDRYWTCFIATLNALGPAVAQPYIANDWDPSGRSVAAAATQSVKEAFGKRIAAAGWLDDPTRQAAQTKLGAVTFLLGYPVPWPSYDDLVVGPSYFANVNALDARSLAMSRSALSTPVDRNAWHISPLEVNATYSDTANLITMTALWLAPPFVVDGAVAARNAGSMSSVIGHELTHGFDDEGRHFDDKGNLRDWWSAAAASGFEDHAQCVIDQFDGYQALPGLNVDGRLSLGENLADLGGVIVAYHALFDGDGSGGGDGFSAEQVFFLSYAQNYCENVRPELEATNLRTDPHSPGKFRVNGPLSNMPEFGKAFQCKAGAPMVRATPCQVW